jgi:hypothetical protein
VSRAKWKQDHQEMGLVYCEGQTCILVPTICNNVSRVKRLPESAMTTGAHRSSSQAGNSIPVIEEPAGGGGGGGGGSILGEQPAMVVAHGSDPVNDPVHSGEGPIHFMPITPPIAWGDGCCWGGGVIVPPVKPPVVDPKPPISPVPEPDSLTMFLTGLVFVLFFSVLKKRKPPRK